MSRDFNGPSEQDMNFRAEVPGAAKKSAGQESRNELSVARQQNQGRREELSDSIKRIQALLAMPEAERSSSMSTAELRAESEKLNGQILRLNDEDQDLLRRQQAA